MFSFIATVLGIIIIWRIERMSAAMDRLRTEVAETKTANESLRTMVAGLAEQIRDTAGDDAAANALADELDQDQGLTAAVLAGTPAEPIADATVEEVPAQPAPTEEPPVEAAPTEEAPTGDTTTGTGTGTGVETPEE